MAARAAVCCRTAAIVYVSEGCDSGTGVLQRVRHTASASAGAACVHSFADAEYNRSSYTLAAPDPESLARAAASVAAEALRAVDMRRHCATHPRLGACDHISFHPLPPPEAATAGGGTMADAAEAARLCAEAVAAAGQVPVYLYGAASAAQHGLAARRRQLGYFRGQAGGRWEGAAAVLPPLQPDYGPAAAPPQSGVVLVGATEWVVSFNVPLVLAGAPPDPGDARRAAGLALARRVARSLSERGGGLPGVEAMALPQWARGVVEVACNLRSPSLSGPAEVERRVGELVAGSAELTLEGAPPAYVVNWSPQRVADEGAALLAARGRS
eukprot:TRINITY_DN30021_c0_g1_i1.p1 TRINITY_DN30021_c0_g1~~TRINITY_DN30021_c0_g1_i1.p1  ORF type:complete len:354 (+),score=68.18 TRINITY_DN30021_c0_g1_i1:84-1064(+)